VPPSPIDVVVGGSDVTGLSFVVVPGAAISGGVVLAAGGVPLRAIVVTATDGDGNLFSTETRDDGTYRLDSLPSGDYTLSAGGGLGAHSELTITNLASGEKRAPVNFLVDAAGALHRTGSAPPGAGGAGGRLRAVRL